ncbi:hypothetical protein C8R44DRAFT_859213 [Mycena epipterygia]|nr:hypothetical protein C8R44DRAFT_859213 [Mycena epipterygia]
MYLFGFGLDLNLRKIPLASRMRGYNCQCSRVEARIMERGLAGINLKLVGIPPCEVLFSKENQTPTPAGGMRVDSIQGMRRLMRDARCEMRDARCGGPSDWMYQRKCFIPFASRAFLIVDMGSVEGRRYNIRTHVARKFESGTARARLQSNVTHASRCQCVRDRAVMI